MTVYPDDPGEMPFSANFILVFNVCQIILLHVSSIQMIKHINSLPIKNPFLLTMSIQVTRYLVVLILDFCLLHFICHEFSITLDFHLLSTSIFIGFPFAMNFHLSYDIASGSKITPCNKICKPLVVYQFSGNVMMSITMLHI